MKGLRLSSAVLAMLVARFALAESSFPIQGTATTMDGDTIEIHDERIRLDAIDAPESRQFCQSNDGSPYRCGQKSAFVLADMISRKPVRCEPKGRDRYRRVIAICFQGAVNLNAWMVEQDWAVAFQKYRIDYISQEDEARLARRGIWAGSFEMPWDWRAKN
jgi:endonuclease YncB( thermonuclease family)